jgi:2-methylisocitrate lyase-like PEP mutase family enzyme
MDRCQRFRNLLKEKDFIVTPGVGNPLHAIIVALDEREQEIMKAGGTLAYLKGRA